MKVLFDTSVLVAAVLERHTHHSRAFPWLQRARGGDIELFVCSRSFAEMYSVLSGLPIRPRISPAQAWRLIQENLRDARRVELSADDYASAIQRVSARGFPGGVVYDALIVHAAEKSEVDKILTFNEKDFRRVSSPEGPSLLVP